LTVSIFAGFSKRLKKKKIVQILLHDTAEIKENMIAMNMDFKSFKHEIFTSLRDFNMYMAQQNEKELVYVEQDDFIMPTLPTVTTEAFAELNQKLMDHSYLCQVAFRLRKNIQARKNINVRVKRVFEELATYDLIVNYSWTGFSRLTAGKKMIIFDRF
jgi:hypothetical protein